MDIVTRDSSPLLTRERTPEGFLLARAAVTRVGVQKYKRGELGAPGDPDEMVGVLRTHDTVFCQDTQNAFRGRPVTMGHPVQSVTPANARRFAVGSTGDTVEEMDDGRLAVTLFIHDKRAIELVESGQDQVSSGYKWSLKEGKGEYEGEAHEYVTDSAMGVNHLALVPAGRLGESVRVLDTDPEGPNMKDAKCTATDCDGAVSLPDMVTDAMVTCPKCGNKFSYGGSGGGGGFGKGKKGGKSMDANDIDVEKIAADAATAAAAAVLKTLDERKAADEKAAKDAADAETAKADQAKHIKDAVKDRTGIVEAAKSILTAEAWEKVADKDNRDIMLAVIGDSVTNAKDRPDDYLRAVLDMQVDTAQAGHARHTVLRSALSGKATDKDMKDAKDTRDDAWKAMADDLTKAWETPPELQQKGA